jgi:ABC-type branched-subunit amino acid transport system permease subunit
MNVDSTYRNRNQEGQMSTWTAVLLASLLDHVLLQALSAVLLGHIQLRLFVFYFSLVTIYAQNYACLLVTDFHGVLKILGY